MKSVSLIVYFLYACISILIVLGDLFGYVTFGYGLGDWLYVIITAGLLILITIFWLINRKGEAGNVHTLLTVVMIAYIILLLLKITLFRGPEYKWNGDLFLP